MPTTPDSIGGQWGTNFGDATVTGGQLVLDGTAGTFMQLPSNLYSGANATALTFEFWATYGSNPNNVYVFAFGVTNYVAGQGIIGFNHAMYCPHNSGGQTASAAPGDPAFSQNVSAPGNLDGQTVHVAVVFDPPNKLLSIYTNGVLEAVNTNFTVNISSLNDQQSYIGQSLWAADPYLTANIDEIRIFKGALSSISIKQSNDQGPNTLLADGPAKFILLPVSSSVPAGQNATFTAATVGYLPITYQWFKNGTLVPGATNASYSFPTTIGDNNDSIVCYATNTIGVTTYVTNTVAVTLNVFVPPTLAWLDSSHGGADSTWNTTSLDWINVSGGGVIAFAQTNGVLFDDRGAGSANVDIGSAIIPYNITVNSASDYMLYSSANTGLLTGQASLTKQNSDTLIIDLTNNLSGGVTISGGKVQVGNGDNFGTLGSGPVTNNATLSINRSDTALNLGNSIHGTGTVSFDGGGSVTISGNSDYSGSTLINQGIVNLQSGTGLGATTGGITIASGGQLYITVNQNIGLKGLTLNGAGDGNGALRKGGAGLTTYNGAVNLGSDSTIGLDGGATLTLSNAVSGSAALTAVGSGTLTFSANSSFTGGFTLNGPVIGLNASHALGTGTITVGGTGRFVLGDGVNLTNFILASSVSPGTATGLLMVNDNTNGTVTTISGPIEFDATPANGNDFIGPISSGYLNVTGPITNTATGAVGSRNGFVRFSGGGNYSTFILNQGTASIGANNGLSTNASLTIAGSAAATFDLNGFNQALTGLSDGAANAELVTNSAAGPSTLTLNLSSGGTYSGVIAGNLALVVNGFGNNLDLVGTNAYTGNTTVTSGSLELATPSLAANSKVTVASGAQLQLDFSVTNTVSGLVLNGVSQPLGVYNNTTSPTYIIGPGSLLVAVTGPGTFTNPTGITSLSLNGANITLNATNGQAGCAYYLLSTTNLALPRNQWTPVATNVLSSNGAYTFIGTNAVNPGAKQQFYLLSNTNN